MSNESFQDKFDRWERATFKPGKYKACVPFFDYKKRTIHIDHVIDSFYDGRQLIIYRVYGKTKQWWHEFMCYNYEMAKYTEEAK